MLKRNDLIEIGQLSYENQEKFGVLPEQLQFISDICHKQSREVHNYIIDNLYSNGLQNAGQMITAMNATKLITCLIEGKKFEFVEWNTPIWHKYKVEEARKKMLEDDNPYISYDKEYSEILPDDEIPIVDDNDENLLTF